MSNNVNFSSLQQNVTASNADQFLVRLNNALSGADGFARIAKLDVEKSLGVYSTVQSNSAAWAIDNTADAGVRALTGNWQSTYLTYSALSSNYVTTDGVQNLSNKTFTSPTTFYGNVTISGDLSCNGTQTFQNTIFSVTSAVSVVHVGAGPALWVGNNGTGDIASFYDIDQNIEILHVGGINSTFPNVGIKTSAPNVELTVNGAISASSAIYALGGNSNNWNNVYSAFNSQSASNASVYSAFNSQSASNASTYSTVNSNSANWQSTYTSFSTQSGNFATLSANAFTGNQTAPNFILSASTGTFQGVVGGAAPQFTAVANTGNGVRVASDRVDFWVGGSAQFAAQAGFIALGSTPLNFGNSNAQLFGGSDGTGRLVERSGTSAQTFSIANTYTSFTNKEELELGWANNNNVGKIRTIKGSSSGTARQLMLGTDSTDRMGFEAASYNTFMLASSGSYGSGSGVLFIGNAATTPSSNPTNGVILYVDNGTIKFRGANGISNSSDWDSTYSTVQTYSAAWTDTAAPTTLTYAASITPSLSDGISRKVTMTGDLTLNAPTNATDGSLWKGRFTASGADRTITLGANIQTPRGTTFSGIVSSGFTRLFEMNYNGTKWWLVRNQEFAP